MKKTHRIFFISLLSAIVILMVLILVAVICFSTTTEQDKIENMAKEWLQQNLYNPDSYKPIEFYPIVTQYDTQNSTLYKTQEQKKDSIMLLIEDIVNNAKLYLHQGRTKNELKTEYDSLSILIAKEDINLCSIQKSLPITGYKLYHKFRSQTQMGGMRVQTLSFYFSCEEIPDLIMEQIKKKEGWRSIFKSIDKGTLELISVKEEEYIPEHNYLMLPVSDLLQ